MDYEEGLNMAKWLLETLLTVAMVWGLIFFAQWVTDGDFQKTVILLFSFVMIDVLHIKSQTSD
jgi:ABC-type uncharacterized transport system permease subunit